MPAPTPHNYAKAHVEGNKISFTYLDSDGQPQAETRPVLLADGLLKLVRRRMEKFHDAIPAARESPQQRRDRKYLSAHPQALLNEAWEQANAMERMELDMMLHKSSHFGISDPHWASDHAGKGEETRVGLPVAD